MCVAVPWCVSVLAVLAVTWVGALSQYSYGDSAYHRTSTNYRPRHNRGSHGNGRTSGYQRSQSSYDNYPQSRSPTYNNYNPHRNTYNAPSYNSRQNTPGYDSYGSSFGSKPRHSRTRRTGHSNEPAYSNYGSTNSRNGHSSHNNGNSNPSYDSYSSRSGRNSSQRRTNPYTDGNARSRTSNRGRYSNRLSSSSRSRSHSHRRRSSSPGSYNPRRTSSEWYRPSSSYRDTFRRHSRTRRGYYQASYNLGDNDYYKYQYPTIPKYNYGYSHDTSGYYGYRDRKIACYQCNYKPGKANYKLVTIRKSVPDPYYPFRYMSVQTKEYVRTPGVAGGWDKCQGALSRREATQYGVYQDRTCEGSCYVRVDSNHMVYRGCYAGEWAVNPHMYGCSYQAGSLYCFCRGDRCNGFQAPSSYTDPYPLGYGSRRQHPYPSDYPRSSRYNPYPRLRTYHRSHPIRSRRHRRRYRRGTEDVDGVQILAENEVEVYKRMMGDDFKISTSTSSGNTDEKNLRRSCYTCKGSSCGRFFKEKDTAKLGVKSDADSYGNCYVKLDSSNQVSRGTYTGEMGVNQHLIGCHIQNGATYCFCHGGNCNNFAVTMETPPETTKVAALKAPATNTTEVKITNSGTKDVQPEVDWDMVLYYIEFPDVEDFKE